MAQWHGDFDAIIDTVEAISSFSGAPTNLQKVYALLRAMISSWTYESTALVWIAEVPGENVFGAKVLFVNDEVISKLKWNFTEWHNGTASRGVFSAEDAKDFARHLAAKSSLPIMTRPRNKNTNPNQDGDLYVLRIVHDLPFNLRLSVGVPAV